MAIGAQRNIKFGFVAAPSGEISLTDGESCDEILAECKLGWVLGMVRGVSLGDKAAERQAENNRLLAAERLAKIVNVIAHWARFQISGVQRSLRTVPG